MDNNLSLTRRIQLKELEILKVFQDICRRHGLRYFAIGGTCLGAVRHKGFIPWDDDVDIGMPYEDYLKFAEIAQKELPSNYALYGHRHPRAFKIAYALRLHDKNTTFFPKECSRVRDYGMGIHIDILVMNGLPAGRFARAVLFAKLKCYRIMNTLMRMQLEVSRSPLRAAAKRLLYFLLAPLRKLKPYYYFTVKQEELLSKYPFGCSDKMMFAWRDFTRSPEGWYSMIFHYDDFKDSVEVPFEDTTIAVPCGYDRYLTMDFGDYMKLPPEEKRISGGARFNLNMIIDFDKPYTYYLDEAGAK
ncbi:MAG: LicD family protein [Synergistaceae bacterium]|nr:LicD family protein [Synergistaceae bacterium]